MAAKAKPNASLSGEFFRAVKKGDVQSASRLLKQDRSLLELREPVGSTPLHAAAWKGQVEVVTTVTERRGRGQLQQPQ
jgi:hypothetical protein